MTAEKENMEETKKKELHRYDWKEVDGKMRRFKPEGVYVWALVCDDTNQVYLDDVREFDDDLTRCLIGCSWKKFYLCLDPTDK